MAGKTGRARKSKAWSKAKSKIETKIETKTETKTESKVKSKTAAKPAPKSAPKSAAKAHVDPITLSVIRGILETTQREMTLSLEKTARSSVFNLAHDYSTALFNHVPEMILQGQDIPIHLGSLIPAMKSVARYFGDDIHEGDLILHNDPAFGGSHAIDVCMYKPVFYKGELRYWTVCKGHLTDIGGPVPAGYNPNATEIYAECLRIPPVKIWDRGKPRTDVINLIFTNMRARRDQEGDFNALIGACQVGERNLLGMVEKYGIAQVDACIDEFLDMADRHMRSLIKAVPDGVYEGTAILEDAGHGLRRFRNHGDRDDQERHLPHRHQEPAANSVFHQFLRGELAFRGLSRTDDVRAIAAAL